MKLLRSANNQLVFHLGRREKDLLLMVLGLYPRIPPAYPRLSRKACLPDAEASQALLEEALAEQRAENKRQLEALLAEPHRFQGDSHGWKFALTPAETEYLLQILNDIRVGSWIALGSPEALRARLTADTAPQLWAMEMAGFFQMQFLAGLEGR